MTDEFETIAITYSQPEAAVMLSFLHWHDVQAYALSEHARIAAHLVTALGGIPIRVPSWQADHARTLLAEVAPAEPPVIRPPVVRPHALSVAALVIALFLGAPPPPPRVGSERI